MRQVRPHMERPMSEPSARGRFVEAMKMLAKLPGYQNAKMAACEAFADAECDGRDIEHFDLEWHDSCRAALVKEVIG